MSDPNSQNQLWSKWLFQVIETGRQVPKADVQYNAARWLRMGFGSVGRVRVYGVPRGWRIEALVEGAPAHDPGYRENVRLEFIRFVEQGWGMWALPKMWEPKIMAGSKQDGRPREQMIEVPSLRLL